VASEDDELVIISRQIAKEVHCNVIALVKVNLEAIVLKLLSYPGGKILVGVTAIKLVYNGCSVAFRDSWSDGLRPVKSKDKNENGDRCNYGNPQSGKAPLLGLPFRLLLDLCFSQ